MQEYFGAYGTIDDAVVMRDKLTGNGRGFGFVTFADGLVAERVIAQRHEIKGRSVEAKSAVPRNEGDVQSRAPMQGGMGGGRYGPNDNSQLINKVPSPPTTSHHHLPIPLAPVQHSPARCAPDAPPLPAAERDVSVPTACRSSLAGSRPRSTRQSSRSTSERTPLDPVPEASLTHGSAHC